MKTRMIITACLLITTTVTASAGAFKCMTNGQIEYSDKPCPGAVEIAFSPTPAIPAKPKRRLIIEHVETQPGYRYNAQQRNRLYHAANDLEQQNADLRHAISQLQAQRERELRNAAISDRDAMAAINLYWQGKTDALQREYDRNQGQINRLRDMAQR